MNFYTIRIGFLIHTAEMFHHYAPVWEQLNQNEFMIVVEGSKFERERIVETCHSYNVNYVSVDDVLNKEYQFPYLISNHVVRMVEDKPVIKLIGKINIRFMYALGKARHNFSDWNKYYDMFLCFGGYHQRELSQFHAPIVQMGYPRYDVFFNHELDLNDLKSQFNCDPKKETILWLPTWLEASSVDLYAKKMSSLMGRYNVIVKLHPHSFELEPEKLAKLKGLDFSLIITQIIDNVFLFAVADKVVCDYGGTAFGAIYLDKPLFLLNVPGVTIGPLIGEESPDIALRKDIVNVDVEGFDKVYEIFDDDQIWLQQKISRQKLRQFYFVPHYGFSSYVAAAAIQNAKNIISMYGQNED